jgi:hypothetical protein
MAMLKILAVYGSSIFYVVDAFIESLHRVFHNSNDFAYFWIVRYSLLSEWRRASQGDEG